jgi:hypothetical protein
MGIGGSLTGEMPFYDDRLKLLSPMEDFFLKSSRRESRSLYEITSDNPQKIIFTTPFLILTNWVPVVSLVQHSL